MNVLIPDQSSGVQKIIENYQVLTDRIRTTGVSAKISISFSFFIKAIEFLENRLIRYKILVFILSIIYKFGCINGGQSREVFRNLMCRDMLESSKRRNFTYTFMGRNFKKGDWAG